MFYDIDQLRTPSDLFTKSDFTVVSVKTSLKKWMLVVAVISVVAYPFLAFSDVTCTLEDTAIGLFWLHWPKLGSSKQEVSLLAGKNTEVLLVPCCTWKSVPTAIIGGVNISEVPEHHLLPQMKSQ